MATAIAHQRNILEMQKPVEIQTWNYLLIFFQKIWIISRDPLNERHKIWPMRKHASNLNYDCLGQESFRILFETTLV